MSRGEEIKIRWRKWVLLPWFCHLFFLAPGLFLSPLPRFFLSTTNATTEKYGLL